MTSVDFQQRLRDLVNLSIRTYTGQAAGFEERDFLIAALTRSHATLLVERDAAVERADNYQLSDEAIGAIREVLDEPGIPCAAFVDDHVRNVVILWKQRGEEIERLTAERDAARAENERLRERLELTHVFVDDGEGGLKKVPAREGMPDGISCRDETIKLQDEELDRLAAERDALMDTLRLILPLAKGYAAANPVGSNAEYVTTAEAALEPAP